MSTYETKTWLVAYDIREPRRLRAVHRALRKVGLAAQYSAFTVEGDDSDIKQLLESLERLIDTGVDDVRAYHIPARCPVWRLGHQHWPDGVTLDAAPAMRLLLDEEPAATRKATEPLTENL